MERSDKWDRWFIGLCRYVATASKDPSTRCGAVVVGAGDRRKIALGFNGFPPGIADDDRLDDRRIKYKLIQHAERNALANATFDCIGATLYCTIPPCIECAKEIVSRRIARVVTPPHPPVEVDRWTVDIPFALSILSEAGIEVSVVIPPEDEVPVVSVVE